MRLRIDRRALRFIIEYGALRLGAALIRLMPLDLATHISAKAWRLLAPRISPRRHRRALDNLRIAFPHASDQERYTIRAAHWENLGRVMAETIRRFEIVDDALLSRYASKLGPAVGVSLHMGNWELAVWPFVVAKANPAALYRTVNNPYIDRYLRERRRSVYPGGMFGRGVVDGDHGEEHRTARMIADFVRRGGRLGIVCDQYYSRGVPVPFFGKSARIQPIAAIIARRVGARIWMARCVRVSTQSRFRIEIRELKVPRSANPAEDVRWSQAAMMRQFERWIRDTPEQWMWSNRVWS